MDIKIYQLIRENSRGLMFARWCEVKDKFDFSKYKEIWSGSSDSIGIRPLEKDIWTMLDIVFEVFNINHPKNFQGHSLSVSDVVKMDDDYYYCDSFGWQKINNKI